MAETLPEPPVPADACAFRSIGEIVRPLVKTLIVEAAIRRVISREKATRLIRERGLEDA